ncbi:hypothetical protein QFZ77_004700 [Paenibacillus sp. V4I3]|uniref:hypothetical protein n=1 Tax=Paenibacillus sp. V4I3 TaxID=3042305 RepID=UPI002789C136|nr:hypothetical protein [Paenibacillus sp. V4I3]MDQ0876041.1 hypothetical protein [Paenibacillus sp. V4I3]
MRRKNIAEVLLLAKSVAFFYGVDIFTNEATRHHSGNGNLGLIPVTLSASVYIPLLLLTIAITHAWASKCRVAVRWAILLCSCCIVVAAIYGEILFINGKMILLGDWDNPESKLYRFPLLNQYTNTFFFNGYTFVGGLAVAVSVGVAVSFRTISSNNT